MTLTLKAFYGLTILAFCFFIIFPLALFFLVFVLGPPTLEPTSNYSYSRMGWGDQPDRNNLPPPHPTPPHPTPSAPPLPRFSARGFEGSTACRRSFRTKKGSRGCNLAQFAYCAFVNTAFTVAFLKVSGFLQLSRSFCGT